MRRGCRRRGPVTAEEGYFAADVSGPHDIERQPPAARGQDADLDLALANQIEGLARVALSEEGRPGLDPHRLRQLLNEIAQSPTR